MKAIVKIERRYVVEVGRQAWIWDGPCDAHARGRVEWAFDRAFDDRVDAEAYANRVAEDYELVRIIDKEAEA